MGKVLMRWKKPMHFSAVYMLGILFFNLNSCSQAQEEEILDVDKKNRVIEFSGYEWIVRTSDEEKLGPGPNYFSDSEENVWVDEEGKLHLKIVQSGGNWYCSGISLRKSMGYNKYVFYVSSRVDQLDKNVVGGLFTYMNDEEEIDIEFSKWSDAENQDSQFAVQPSYIVGNKERYDLKLDNNLSTHFFDWQTDKIDFGSFYGHTLTPKDTDIISTWTYTGENIPPDSEERLKINLWLFQGQNPSDNQEVEMIIDRVEIY